MIIKVWCYSLEFTEGQVQLMIVIGVILSLIAFFTGMHYLHMLIGKLGIMGITGILLIMGIMILIYLTPKVNKEGK